MAGGKAITLDGRLVSCMLVMKILSHDMETLFVEMALCVRTLPFVLCMVSNNPIIWIKYQLANDNSLYKIRSRTVVDKYYISESYWVNCDVIFILIAKTTKAGFISAKVVTLSKIAHQCRNLAVYFQWTMPFYCFTSNMFHYIPRENMMP